MSEWGKRITDLSTLAMNGVNQGVHIFLTRYDKFI